MAMLVLEIQEGGPVPTGNLCDPKTNPASVVPGIVAQALGWPNSRVLYDGYRLLWSNVERGQTKDMYKHFRGNQVENVKARRGVNARLTAILGQFTLQWLDNYEDLSYPQSDFSYQQLTREYPVFADDVEHMRIAAESQPEIPENVRRLIEECKLRLQRFAKRVCFVSEHTQMRTFFWEEEATATRNTPTGAVQPADGPEACVVRGAEPHALQRRLGGFSAPLRLQGLLEYRCPL